MSERLTFPHQLRKRFFGGRAFSALTHRVGPQADGGAVEKLRLAGGPHGLMPRMMFPKDTLESLWAPWRYEYFSIDKSVDFLSAAAQSSDDAASLVVQRGRTGFLMMNRYPYSVGHLMAVPYRKVGDLAGLTDEEKVELFDLAIAAQRILRKVVKAQGFNVGFNLGVCAGAGVADYLHLHIVPRWEADTNFMPVLAGTRVQPQAIEEVYRQLVAAARADDNAA